MAGAQAAPAFEAPVDQLTPIRCPGLDRIVAVAAGGSERLALTSDGSVLAWGSSPSDLSGTGGVLGPARWGSAPRAVEGLPDVIRGIDVAITTASRSRPTERCSHGARATWGRSATARARTDPPVRVDGLGAGVRAIAAGYGCSYALTGDGAVLSWGWNQQGRLGDGSPTTTPNDTATGRPAPGPVPALRGGVAAIGEFVALMGDGSSARPRSGGTV